MDKNLLVYGAPPRIVLAASMHLPPAPMYSTRIQQRPTKANWLHQEMRDPARAPCDVLFMAILRVVFVRRRLRQAGLRNRRP